jgi:transposase
MGLRRDCTRILGLDGFRVERIEWDRDEPRAPVRIHIERRGSRGYECSGCRRRTWRVRDRAERTWDDLPWAEQRVTLIYGQRRVDCRTCGIRTERVAFADPKARITRRLRQMIGLDCQSMPDVPRRRAARRQLEQSPSSGESVLDGMGGHAAEAPAAAFGR